MPYMPTNYYPKNCAILKKDSYGHSDIDFLAKLDNNDDIKMYRLMVYEYDTNECIFNIFQYNNGTNQNRISISSMQITEELNKTYTLTGSNIAARTLTQISADTIRITYPYNTTTLSMKHAIKNATKLWKTSITSSNKIYKTAGGPMFFNIKVTLNEDYKNRGYIFTIKFDEDITGVFTTGGIGSTTTSYNLFFYSPFDFSVDLSEYGGYQGFPINNNNEFKLPILNLSLPKNKYYWILKIASNDYDVWLTDGEVQDTYSTGNPTFPYGIKIFPNALDSSEKRIYNTSGDYSSFTILREYYDKTATATNIEVTDETTTVTLSKNMPAISDFTDVYATIDTTEYKVISLSEKTLKVQGVHPLTSDTVFGQYVNIYRKYLSLGCQKNLFEAGDEFSIYSQAMESNMNYFTTINRTLSNFYNNTTSSIVKSFSPTYSGKINWYQFELKRGDIIVDKTDKIYSNKINYQYNNFYTDNKDNPQTYYLTLLIQDIKNYTYKKTITISASYYREGTSDKLKVYWDDKRKAVKLDLSEFVSSEASFYKNNVKVDNLWYLWNDNSLMIKDTEGIIAYKEKTEGFVEFNRNSNMLVKLKLHKDFKAGPIFSFGEKTFAINEDYSMYVFDTDKMTNIYSNVNNLIHIPDENTDYIDTNYILIADETIPLTDESILKSSDVLYSDYWYVLIEQSQGIGTITVFSNNLNYKPKSFNFNVYNSTIYGITLYNSVYFNYIKVSSSEIQGINKNTYAINEEKAFTWDNGTYFLTDYKNQKLNVSNFEPYPAYSQPSEILVYKQCNLLDNSQFLFVGSYPYNLKTLYDYSVADAHEYTYYIIKTYINESGVAGALSEIISQTIVPDYYEIDVFGTDYKLSNIDKNIYIIDKTQKWYFELDALSDNINFVTEENIYSFNRYARANKSDVNYMQGTVTTKLGNIENEVTYTNDNRHKLEEFKHFSNSNNIKIIRLKDGLIIPVSITLKQKTNQSNLVGNPTDISFDWYQVADAETAVLVEYEVE